MSCPSSQGLYSGVLPVLLGDPGGMGRKGGSSPAPCPCSTFCILSQGSGGQGQAGRAQDHPAPLNAASLCHGLQYPLALALSFSRWLCAHPELCRLPVTPSLAGPLSPRDLIAKGSLVSVWLSLVGGGGGGMDPLPTEQGVPGAWVKHCLLDAEVQESRASASLPPASHF